jgi:hypothetical protein
MSGFIMNTKSNERGSGHPYVAIRETVVQETIESDQSSSAMSLMRKQLFATEPGAGDHIPDRKQTQELRVLKAYQRI